MMNSIGRENIAPEETPSWDIIAHALRSLQSRPDFDLSAIGPTQRLDYKDFEVIFYNLFVLIDPPDCRRKFRSLYPARNPDEQSRFIEQTVQFINGKKLSLSRINASQLRMCGGEPFRRLLGSLIKRAANSEIATLAKKMEGSIEDIPINSNDLDDLVDALEQERAFVRKKLTELADCVAKFNRLEEEFLEMKREADDRMESGIFGEISFFDSSRVKEIRKSLVARLEASNARCFTAANQIKQIHLPMDEPETDGTPVLKRNTSKRMSQFIREMRECLTLTPEADKGVKVNNLNILEQLAEYDKGIDDLIETWREEQRKIDEALLQLPAMQERYRFFEQLIPNIANFIQPIKMPWGLKKD